MSEFIKRHERLEDIPRRNYEGYIWKSDQQEPEILKGDKEVTLSSEENPFVVETLLYDSRSQTSVKVQHNGSYLIYLIREFYLSQLPENCETNTKKYFSHRLDGFSKLNFKQIWLPVPNSNCEGMEVLNLKATVFIGFDKN